MKPIKYIVYPLLIACVSGCDLSLEFPYKNSFFSSSSLSSISSQTSSAFVSTGDPKSVYLNGTGEEQEGELELYFFQLENERSLTQVGDAYYIRYGTVDILIDAGVQNIGSNVVLPYLKDRVTDGVIELCINTHTDEDHMGGFLGLKSGGEYTGILSTEMEIRYFIDSGYQAKTLIYENYRAELQKKIETGTQYYSYAQTMSEENVPNRLILGPETYIDILDSKIYENDFAVSNNINDYSVPVILTHGKTKFLLMGDCEKKAEQAVLDRNALDHVDFFKANHHGSPTSNNKFLLDAIAPDYVLIDATASNKYNLPKKEIVDRFLEYTPEIYTPFLSGGIHVYSDKETLRFDCDGYRQYEDGKKGEIREGTVGAPLRIQDSAWYSEAI